MDVFCHIIPLTLITQDDRLTNGAWAACELIGSNLIRLCASNHKGHIEFTQHKADCTKCYSSTIQAP